MPADELARLRTHLDTLHQAITELIGMQRVQLTDQSSSVAAPVLDQLAGIEERLRAHERDAQGDGERTHLAEIDVERINIVDADGRLRLAISNAGRAPDPVIDGTTAKRQDGNPAGLIFYNDEGDECGGLVYGGGRRDGYVTAGGALLFDQYKQDQAVGIMYTDEDGRRTAGIKVWDRPDEPLSQQFMTYQALEQLPDGPEKSEAIEQLRATGAFGAARLFIGKTAEHEAVVNLHDGEGRVRLRLSVDADGAASLQFLDETGQVTYALPSATAAPESRCE